MRVKFDDKCEVIFNKLKEFMNNLEDILLVEAYENLNIKLLHFRKMIDLNCKV